VYSWHSGQSVDSYDHRWPATVQSARQTHDSFSKRHTDTLTHVSELFTRSQWRLAIQQDLSLSSELTVSRAVIIESFFDKSDMDLASIDCSWRPVMSVYTHTHVYTHVGGPAVMWTSSALVSDWQDMFHVNWVSQSMTTWWDCVSCDSFSSSIYLWLTLTLTSLTDTKPPV